MSPARFPILHAARAVAAFGVVMCHAGTYSGMQFAWLGEAGVAFFFLLSGYLMQHCYLRRRFNLAAFWQARAARIYAPYLPVGIACMAAYAMLGRDFDWLASLALLPGETALIPAWTLQREVFFYALCGVLFWARIPLAGALIWATLIIAIEPSNAAIEVAFGAQNLWFVAGIVLRETVAAPTLRVPGFGLLGEASYSIYLVHLPVMGGLWRIGANFPTLIAGGLAAGIAYHVAIERPLLAWIKHRSHPKASTLLGFPRLRIPTRSFRPQPERR